MSKMGKITGLAIWFTVWVAGCGLVDYFQVPGVPAMLIGVLIWKIGNLLEIIYLLSLE
jgi:hypothetical protein